MKNNDITYNVGYGILGLVVLLGALLLWNARATINTRITEAEEAAKPAEIELTLITPSDCDLCVDGTILMEEMEKQDVRLLDSKTLTQDSQEGIDLIETYGITRLPAILVNGQYDKQNVSETFSSLGGNEQDGTLVIEVQQPVYLDLASGDTVGLVDVTYLTDSSCTDCYDPVTHKPILENTFGVVIASESSVNAQSSEGLALIAQYAIAQTPTILLSSQALAYDRLAQTWKQVGTVEEDGTLIFRANTALGNVTYKDVETNQIIRPEASSE